MINDELNYAIVYIFLSPFLFPKLVIPFPTKLHSKLLISFVYIVTISPSP